MNSSKKRRQRDSEEHSRLRGQRTHSTKFVADAMLGSLARKLRALGFDTSYYREGDDSGLMAIARGEGRWILTSDRFLASVASSRGLTAVLLEGRSDGVRLGEIATAASQLEKPLSRGDSLCSKCGAGLVRVVRNDIAGLIPPSVLLRHRSFFRCLSCGQVYWHGSHWKKLRSLARRLD